MEIKKLEDGEFGHVIALRDPDDDFKRETNINKKIGQSNDFEWGYSGGGPSDFALNILLHFTSGDEAFARKHCIDFRELLVTTLPRNGGTIHKESILDFINEKRIATT